VAPASIVYGLLQGVLTQPIGAHLPRRENRCRRITIPGVIPNVLAADSVRLPDLGVTSAPIQFGQQTIVDQVLLIESLSPGKPAETLSNIWACTTIPLVHEILVPQSNAAAVHVLRRGDTGYWPETPEKLLSGELNQTLTGFYVALAHVYTGTDLVG